MTNYEYIRTLDLSQIQKFMAMCENREIEFEIMNCGNCKTEGHPFDCSVCMIHWLASDCQREHGLRGEL